MNRFLAAMSLRARHGCSQTWLRAAIATASLLLAFVACDQEAPSSRLGVVPTGNSIQVVYNACPNEEFEQYPVKVLANHDGNTIDWRVTEGTSAHPWIASPSEIVRNLSDRYAGATLTVRMATEDGTASLSGFAVRDVFRLGGSEVLTGEGVEELDSWKRSEPSGC